tara:strand:- start:39940 stop:40044 length:105 start_codon:yes stop_codon:yes gene_type:complete
MIVHESAGGYDSTMPISNQAAARHLADGKLFGSN